MDSRKPQPAAMSGGGAFERSGHDRLGTGSGARQKPSRVSPCNLSALNTTGRKAGFESATGGTRSRVFCTIISSDKRNMPQ